MPRRTLTVAKPMGQDAVIDPSEGYSLLNQDQVVNLRVLLELTESAQAKSEKVWRQRLRTLASRTVGMARRADKSADRVKHGVAVLRRVPEAVSPGLEFVLIALPSAEDIERARPVAVWRSPGDDEYDVNELARLFLRWPSPATLGSFTEKAAKWLGGEILKVSDERSGRILRKLQPQKFSRDVLAFHCREHERFDDMWTKEFIRIVDQRTPPPRGDLRSYVSRGRNKVFERLGGICPLDDEEHLSHIHRVALMTVRKLWTDELSTRAAGVLQD